MRKIIKILTIYLFIPIFFSLAIDALYFNFLTPLADYQAGIINSSNEIKGRVLGASEVNQESVEENGIKLNQPEPNLTDLSGKFEKNGIFKISNDQYVLPAANGAVLDCDNDELTFNKNADKEWPIASITKLFTVLVFIKYNPGWDAEYTIKTADRREGGKIILFTGDRVKVKDLFYFSLVGSDNTATVALVNSSGFKENEFVNKMNEEAKKMGLKQTYFKDVTGLSAANVSTAREVALFTKASLTNEDISRASLAKKYEFYTAQGKKKIIYSTNELLSSYPDNKIKLVGGKTGFVEASSYCFAGKFTDNSGKEIVSVVLGAAKESERFTLTKKLVNLSYGNNK